MTRNLDGMAGGDIREASCISDALASEATVPPPTIQDPLSGPLVWSEVDFDHEDSFSLRLDQADVEEIQHALAKFKTLGLDGDRVERGNFPLPTLGPRLLDGAVTLHSGRGFFVIRGLNMSSYSIEDSVTIFLAIASYIADQRGLQDRKGNMLSHITDSKLWTVPPNRRHGIHSPAALPYHNDMGCDVLSLQVRQGAESGGQTYLSSLWTAFNQLLVEDPAVIETLLAPEWPVQLSGQQARYYLAPALTIHKGKLMASLDPNRFGPHPNSEANDVPNLTAAQTRALEIISKTARRNEVCLRLRTGDMLFFNNWSLLHRRDAYVDGKDTSRHMIRLWLRNRQLGWDVPASMRLPWLAAYGDKPESQSYLYPLVPMPEYKAPRYSAGSAAFCLEDSDFSDD